MRAPVSVVIPTLNAESALVETLSALFEGVQAGLIRELIVVDGGSTDGTVALAAEAGAEVLRTEPSRGGQLRTGCAAARGEWLLVLHADTVLHEGWSDPVAAHLCGKQAACFRLKFDDTSLMARLTASWANLRTRLFGLPFGDQGLLIPRDLYQWCGGYPDQPLMEDLALARALKRRITLLDCAAITSSARYRDQGWLRRGARNLWLQARYFAGAPPEQLAKDYKRP